MFIVHGGNGWSAKAKAKAKASATATATSIQHKHPIRVQQKCNSYKWFVDGPNFRWFQSGRDGWKHAMPLKRHTLVYRALFTIPSSLCLKSQNVIHLVVVITGWLVGCCCCCCCCYCWCLRFSLWGCYYRFGRWAPMKCGAFKVDELAMYRGVVNELRKDIMYSKCTIFVIIFCNHNGWMWRWRAVKSSRNSQLPSSFIHRLLWVGEGAFHFIFTIFFLLSLLLLIFLLLLILLLWLIDGERA